MFRKQNSLLDLSGTMKAVILIGGPHVGKLCRVLKLGSTIQPFCAHSCLTLDPWGYEGIEVIQSS